MQIYKLNKFQRVKVVDKNIVIQVNRENLLLETTQIAMQRQDW
jgi:hypothetical protein